MQNQKKPPLGSFEPEEPLSQEDLENMTSLAKDFLLKDIENLKLFIKKMQDDFEQNDLIFIIKMFVLNRNKVFDMAQYMAKQSQLAEKYVKIHKRNSSPEERRLMMNKWIEENAGPYRKRAIFNQMQHIDKMAAEIAPAIEEAIKE